MVMPVSSGSENLCEKRQRFSNVSPRANVRCCLRASHICKISIVAENTKRRRYLRLHFISCELSVEVTSDIILRRRVTRCAKPEAVGHLTRGKTRMRCKCALSCATRAVG